MDTSNNKTLPSLSLSLLTSPIPAIPVSTSPTNYRPSQSPFRYVQFHQGTQDLNEVSDGGETPLSEITRQSQGPSSVSKQTPRLHIGAAYRSSSTPFEPRSPRTQLSSSSRQQSPFLSSTHSRSHSTSYARPQLFQITTTLRPWIPIILYALTSFGFVIAIACFRDKVFTGLDELSRWLRADEHYGQAVLFFLIFLTTFPPIPLYSTLITLSGYTFGIWTGAIISYFAALTGALTVFIISRSLLHDTISCWLASTCTIKRVVRAIEKRPKLLFLIRLAPYPYNVMNCLLAASPTLTLRTYTICTALSLFKVIIHTSLGASIHSFKDYHAAPGSDGKPVSAADGSAMTGRIWTIVGVVLCVAIFIYLSIVARRAVDDELEDETSPNSEERMAFLPSGDVENQDLEANDVWTGRSMVEAPFSTTQLVQFRHGETQA